MLLNGQKFKTSRHFSGDEPGPLFIFIVYKLKEDQGADNFFCGLQVQKWRIKSTYKILNIVKLLLALKVYTTGKRCSYVRKLEFYFAKVSSSI